MIRRYFYSLFLSFVVSVPGCVIQGRAAEAPGARHRRLGCRFVELRFKERNLGKGGVGSHERRTTDGV